MHNLKTSLVLVLLLVLGFRGTLQAQVTDTTQVNQLETNPPAQPVVVPIDTIPAPAPISRQKVEEEPKPTLLQKLFVGGSGDLGFQSNPYYGNFFNIGLSPIIGYKLTKNFAVGPGFIYQFYNIGGNKFHDYGYKIFAQYLIYKGILAHAEHEVRNTQYEPGSITSNNRYTLRTTLAGGGYRQMASDRFGFDIYVLFPVITSADNAVSSSPVIRGGFIYHLK